MSTASDAFPAVRFHSDDGEPITINLNIQNKSNTTAIANSTLCTTDACHAQEFSAALACSNCGHCPSPEHFSLLSHHFQRHLDHAELSTPLTQRAWFKVFIVAVGFLIDSYDLFIMNLVLVLVDLSEKASGRGGLSSSDQSIIVVAVSVGAVIGQVSFGALADEIGRRKAFILSISGLIIGAISSSLTIHSSVLSVAWSLAICRFILGIAIGGEYPISSTVTVENATRDESEHRGKRLATVFSMQGLGLVFSPIVILILLVLCPRGNYEEIWRIALGLSAVPAMLMFVYRWNMSETEAFKLSRHHRPTHYTVSMFIQGIEEWGNTIWEHRMKLVGTCGNWFIFDIVFYANGLFSAQVIGNRLTKPAIDDTPAVTNYLTELATATLILACLAVPGYFAATLLIDRIGRRRLQLLGFLGMAVMYTITGLCIEATKDILTLFYFLYGFTFFFCNFGPNVTTYVIPGESFPTRIRASCHGISAAVGKAGAILGGIIMPMIMEQTSLDVVLYISAGISMAGALWTIVFTEESMNFSVVDAVDRSKAGSRSQSHSAIALTPAAAPADQHDESALLKAPVEAPPAEHEQQH